MKRTFTLCIISCLVISSGNVLAQYTNGLISRFGIDGDVMANARLQGTWTASGSCDWFNTAAGTGFGVIDTSGAATLKAQLMTGQNITFVRGMSVPKFSVKDNMLLLDAKYARDFFGNSAGNDRTIFTNGAKNGDVPTSWGTNPTGASLQDKVDIIDAYTYMWRNGTNIAAPNPSNLNIAIGASLMATTGSRYVDFEMFVSPLAYNSLTGVFSNSGPSTTGGHTMWEFNANGTVKKIGDMDLSFSFSSATVDTIAMYIWVSRTTFNTVTPASFRFVPGEFYGANNLASFGYAKVIPIGSDIFPAFGAVNTSNVSGPVWGTASKDLGLLSNAYYSPRNSIGQFAEAGINLTALGIDPVLIGGPDICSPIFRKVMIKTRASASFASSLADFTSPMDFVDASFVPANVMTPQTLTCSRTTVQLRPATINPVIYSWSTANGSIIGRTDTAVITVNAPGKYYLSAAYMSGCPLNRDSVTVLRDVIQPVATANTYSSLNPNDPNSTVTVVGGDVAASSVMTPFGGSAGLTWSWTGPAPFPGATTKDVVTNIAGQYRLILTELRNGCKDTAQTTVLSLLVLPLQILEFSARKSGRESINIQTKFNDNRQVVDMTLTRSTDGMNFEPIHHFRSAGTDAAQTSFYNDRNIGSLAGMVYYRMIIRHPEGRTSYSPVARVNLSGSDHGLTISPNPVTDHSVILIESSSDQVARLQIRDMGGKLLSDEPVRLRKGSNRLSMNALTGKLPQGRYVLMMITGDDKIPASFIK